MADTNTPELEAQVDAAFLGATLNTDTPPAPAAKVVEQPGGTATETTTSDATPAEATPPAPKQRYVRVTEEEWNNQKAAIGKISSLESRLARLPDPDKLVQQIADKVTASVRAQTPAGGEIDPQVLADAFADQERDFPELAAQNRKALEHVLKNLRGTGQPTPAIDLEDRVQKVALKLEAEDLADAYPDWSDIVGRPKQAGDAVNDQTEYRQWLAKQDGAYQEKIGTTNRPAVVRASLDRFFREKAASAAPSPPPDRAAARRAVIADAVTPRADGNPPPLNQPKTADDAFNEGFRSVKRQ